MGITGLFKELGPGTRTSLAKLSADHYILHCRPFRLAIDISIWLFQVQSGKGGSNPALRTFYYRLLRLLTLNIHPLFVFDGPNKPEWKRGKRVGGPGVRVASVPEFLAKQLLKHFGFPWHVAPGEAEAECALLQREGVLDAVLSEDVDTLMFGSRVTLRNWSAEGSTKSPTHVSVYREEETMERSRLDREAMVLVALMSGGDYIPTGIAGCGPKLACDAARAGFGRSLCRLKRRDVEGLARWKEELVTEVRTNASKHFSKKNTGFSIPDDFPNWEVLGYYTHPCVSSADKVRQMKESVEWDQSIDFAALRSFTADAFDWRCIGGAKKFIKNLAPAMLVRQLRLQGIPTGTQIAQEEQEEALVHAIHGKRNHFTVDGELQYRITFTPANFVPIDLSIEEEDDQFNPAGGNGMDSDAESDFMAIPASTPLPDEVAEEPTSPSKKRTYKPYHPDQPEKLWLLRSFLQLGCPLLVETYETPLQDAKEFLKARRKARLAAKGDGNIHAGAKPKKTRKAKTVGGQENALMQYARVTKARDDGRDALQEMSQGTNSTGSQTVVISKAVADGVDDAISAFKMPLTQLSAPATRRPSSVLPSTQPAPQTVSLLSDPARPFAAFAAPRTQSAPRREPDAQQRTPRKSKKRRSSDLSSPAMSQRSITSYYSPSPRKAKKAGNWVVETIDLVSSSPMHASMEEEGGRPRTPTPEDAAVLDLELPATVTKRRRRGPLRRALTAPATAMMGGEAGSEDQMAVASLATDEDVGGFLRAEGVVETTSSSPMKQSLTHPQFIAEDEEDDDGLPSPDDFLLRRRPQSSLADGGFLVDDDDDATPKPLQRIQVAGLSSPPASPSRYLEHINPERVNLSEADEWLQDPELDHVPLPPPVGSQAFLPSPPTKATHAPSAAPIPQSKRPKHRPSEALVGESLRRSPRHSPPSQTNQPHRLPAEPEPKPKPKKKVLIIPRASLAGAWKEVSADSARVEALDLTGDGSGWRVSGGRAKLVAVGVGCRDGGQGRGRGREGKGYRKSGVEVLDLTGA